MYRKPESDNHRVVLAGLVPWQTIEVKYASQFSDSHGRPAIPLRVAPGTLIIEEISRSSDEELVLQIRESPCLQYFPSFPGYLDEPPFDSSIMVHVRKRLTGSILKEVNALILESRRERESVSDSTNRQDRQDGGSPGNQGKHEGDSGGVGGADGSGTETIATGHDSGEKERSGGNSETLIMDATCAPGDMRYPQDVSHPRRSEAEDRNG